jgi:hypothetical protein
MDVTLADHDHRTFPTGPECNFKNQTEFPTDVSPTEACIVVVLSCQGKGFKVGKEIGKGWGQERGRMHMSSRPHSWTLQKQVDDVLGRSSCTWLQFLSFKSIPPIDLLWSCMHLGFLISFPSLIVETMVASWKVDMSQASCPSTSTLTFLCYGMQQVHLSSTLPGWQPVVHFFLFSQSVPATFIPCCLRRRQRSGEL